jgi:hypothetical protein
MGIRHSLKYSIATIFEHNREGSVTVRRHRIYLLNLWIDALCATGSGVSHINALKTQHIQNVVNRWKQKGLSSSTLKSRLSALRYIMKKLRKPEVVPSNKVLGIPNRPKTESINRAWHHPDFSAITNPYIFTSLHLQRVFGLSREEAIKFPPHIVEYSNTLRLQAAWCRSGTGRQVPITTDEQRYWLDKAKQLANHGGSLIPPNLHYYRYRRMYDNAVIAAGFSNLNGLRYSYAQTRYKALTGWEAPINGGLTSKQLTPEQRKIDQEVRVQLASEMGVSREQNVAIYLGK